MMAGHNSRLWVCWARPPEQPQSCDTVLSFLRPSCEENLRTEHSCEVVAGREESLSIRSESRETYLRLVARIGTARLSDGMTLRQALGKDKITSSWWYHPVSFKDCEVDPTFDRIIAIKTIRKVADERGITNIEFVGAPKPVCEVPRPLYRITSRSEVDEASWKCSLRAEIGR